MENNIQILSNKNLRTFVGISFFIHILCFSFLIFSPANFLSKEIKIPQAMRVDAVGLPDIQPAKPAPAKVSAPKKKPAPKPLVKKKKKKEKPKPKKKKQPPPKKKPAPKKEKKETRKEAQATALEKLRDSSNEPSTYKGEKVSKGTSSEGEVDQLLIYAYFTRVRASVKSRWHLPRILADKNLKAVVIIEVSERGVVTRIQIEQTSGSEAFDQIVIETIQAASPLPEPPKELIPILRQGVGFRFPD